MTAAQRVIQREADQFARVFEAERKAFPGASAILSNLTPVRDRIRAAMKRRGVSREAVEEHLQGIIDRYYKNLKPAADPGTPHAARDLTFFRWALEPDEEE